MSVRAIFLVGFMACGKTTTGKRLAHRLGWDFLDLDAEIERREGQTVAEIFRDRGEFGLNGYREAEHCALRDLIENLTSDTVVALGGGTFYQPRNHTVLERWPSVFLDAPVEELWTRSQDDVSKRPLRKDNFFEFKELYAKRLSAYQQAKVTIVTAGRSTSSICDEIESILQVRGTAHPSAPTQVDPAGFGRGETE